MNELISVGVILLLALLAGRIVKFLRVPEVTGYLLAGVALGPSVLGWVNEANLNALGVLSEVALGLILFSIGTVFEIRQFRRIGKRLALITLCEAGLSSGLVFGTLLLTGQPFQVALLLGIISIETAAASTLMVLRECNAEGPLTNTLTGVFALDNLLCLFLFNVALIAFEYTRGAGLTLSAIGGSLFQLAWQFLGAMA